jgi:hypothetical protein
MNPGNLPGVNISMCRGMNQIRGRVATFTMSARSGSRRVVHGPAVRTTRSASTSPSEVTTRTPSERGSIALTVVWYRTDAPWLSASSVAATTASSDRRAPPRVSSTPMSLSST